jgi:hypothetical protein
MLGIPAPEAIGIASIAVIDRINTIARIFRFIFPFSLIYSTNIVAVNRYLTIMEQGSSAFFNRVKHAFNIRDSQQPLRIDNVINISSALV